MKTFLIHHAPKTTAQDTWALSFSLPYIACLYARAGDGLWYVKTWLTADQIQKRLSILVADQDELRIHELGREVAVLNARFNWLAGRLDDDEAAAASISSALSGPRAAWQAFQAVVADLMTPLAEPQLTVTSAGNLRAA
ncbi:MAG: hypothetical protein ACRCS9_14615 [Hyphomicrobium sp.]